MFSMVPFGRRSRRLPDIYGRNFDRLFDMFDSGMSTDIVDQGDCFELTSELPSLDKDDIKITIDDNYLSIDVDRKDEREEKKENYVLQERRSYNYSRRFDIQGIDKDKIKAKYKNGILKLELPKLEDVKEEKDYLDIEFED